VRCKLRADPAAREVARLGHLGELLDLGCGRGQLGVMLLELGRATRVRGCDWNRKKVAAAREAAAGLAAEFERADVRRFEPGTRAVDTVVLMDVVHYLAPVEQDDVLRRAARCVREGGRLILRGPDARRGWRSGVMRALYRAKTLRPGRLGVRDVEAELVPLLEREGLRCEVRPSWGRTPLGNVMVVGRR
jgi:2-polyprenyl-3-methyl-5-hydroxy-6-metoxy-1,4-benzoquinol methylase